jgi:hypothetical protein
VLPLRLNAAAQVARRTTETNLILAGFCLCGNAGSSRSRRQPQVAEKMRARLDRVGPRAPLFTCIFAVIYYPSKPVLGSHINDIVIGQREQARERTKKRKKLNGTSGLPRRQPPPNLGSLRLKKTAGLYTVTESTTLTTSGTVLTVRTLVLGEL